MKRFVKENKGITLIALIITIIVMLILVAVTINVALNGGIFNKATDAKQKTQREADREELLSSVYATLDKSGNLQIEDELENYLPEGWDLEPSNNAKYLACTSAKDGLFYVNIETGAILDALPSTEGGDSGDKEEQGDESGEESQGETRYNVTVKNLNTIDWTQVFTSRESGYTYLLYLIPSGETIETAFTTYNVYQLELEFNNDENRSFNSCNIGLISANNGYSLESNGTWYDKASETTLPTMEINNALIVPESVVSSTVQTMGNKYCALPDAEVASLLNLTPSN